MKVLIVSCAWPGPAPDSSHGLFRRFDMMAEAVRRVAQRVDALFFLADSTLLAIGGEQAASASLSQRWGMEVRAHLCARRRQTNHGAWQTFGAPALSFMAQEPYLETGGPAQRQALRDALLDRPDAIFVHRLRAMPPLLTLGAPLPPIAFDLDDIEHVSYRQSLDQLPQWRGKVLLRLRVPALRRGERRALELATCTFVCSDDDSKRLQQEVGAGRVAVIPNAVDLPVLTPLTKNSVLMSIGQYSYGPNRAGIEHFLDHVWPLLRKQRTDISLVVAGPNSHQIRHFGSPPPGVRFPGFVADLGALYASSRVVVCPILSGSGTRVKLVEAAAWGRPIVSTRLGAEGLGMEDGVQALLRDDAPGMAEACLRVLADDALAQTLADGARRLAAERYDRSVVVEKVARIFREMHASKR